MICGVEPQVRVEEGIRRNADGDAGHALNVWLRILRDYIA